MHSQNSIWLKGNYTACLARIFLQDTADECAILAQFIKGNFMCFPTGITFYDQSLTGFMLHEAMVHLRTTNIHSHKEKGRSVICLYPMFNF